jgi:hypothetical protein
VLCRDRRAVAEYRGALEDIVELTDVSGPVVLQECSLRTAGETRGWTTVRDPDLFEENVAQGENVLFVVSQRRNADVEHLYPIVKIFPEGAPFDGF